ncbi:MAG: class I SAM-dependent methyltransferase [Desulfobacterales bacterium]|nr:class I SAM-dependent methyltransferase [Desulfobacterales bacterium]
MLDHEKKESIKFWDNAATKWRKFAHDEDNNRMVFPTSQVRQDIVLTEISKSSDLNLHILDIGCADGGLTIELVRRGFTNSIGIDNSQRMINEAKRRFSEEFPSLDPDKHFIVSDADTLNMDHSFDYISALGLIEYVQNTDNFLSIIHSLLSNNGIAFIESRNKLFNVFSANKYTFESDIEKLVSELDKTSKLSPLKDNYESIVRETFINIGNFLQQNKTQSDINRPEFESYPFSLPQYSPLEFVEFCKNNNLIVENIIFYHCHPFTPAFEKLMPQTYNTIGLLMQPLGYTPIGSTISSSFIGKLSK